MSSSEAPGEVVSIDVTAEPATEIFVIDHAFHLRGRGIGRLRTELPPGVYKVKYRTASAIKEDYQVIEPGAGTITIHGPELRFSTPAPLAGTLTTASEHEDAARELSLEVHDRKGAGSQLFLFVRDRSASAAAGSRAAATVHDLDGKTLFSVDDLGRSGAGPNGWWTGCTVNVDPGAYRLRIRRPEWGEVEQIVVTARGWQTQTFVDQEDDVAGADDLTVLMAGLGAGFVPDARDSRLAELTRLALTNHRSVLDEPWIQRLATGEYDDPMLGVYGAHQLVSEGDAEPGTLAAIVDHLRLALGSHPDVEVLSLVTDASNHRPLDSPPMLESSWSIVLREASRHPGLVPAASLMSLIAGHLWGSGCWLMWMPDRLEPPVELTVPTDEGIRRLADAGHLLGSAPDDAGLAPAEGLTEMEQAVLAQLTRRARRKADPSRVDKRATDEGPSVTVEQLAASVAVPPATLKATVAGLLVKFDDGTDEPRSGENEPG